MRFLLVLLVCLLIQAFADPRIGLNVGTNTGLSDVAANGIVSSSWSSNGLTHTFDENMFSTTFYVSLVPGGPDPQPISVNTQTISGGFVATASSTATSVSINGPAAVVTVNFQCNSNSQGVGVLNIQLTPPYDTISIYFNKVCELPQLNIGFLTANGYVADIVSNSVVNPNWKFKASQYELQSNFYVWLTPSQTLVNQKFVSQSFSFVTAAMQAVVSTPTGPAVPLQLGSTPASISVTYNCVPEAHASVSLVTLNIGYGWNSSFPLQWLKQCDNQTNANPPALLNVGTKIGKSDVVSLGITQNNWSGPIGMNFSADTQEIDFYLWLNTTDPSKSYSYEMSFAGMIPAVTYDTETSNTKGLVPNPNGIGIPVKVPVEIICMQNGTETTSVTINVPGYNVVNFYFTVQCIEPLFSVGMTPGDGSAVEDNVVDPEWNYVSPSYDAFTDFYVTIDPSTGIDSYSFFVTDTDFDSNILSPMAVPINGYVTDDKPQQIRVIYNCIDGKPPTTTSVTMTMYYYWNYNLTIKWYKQCPLSNPSPAPIPPSPTGGSSSGWSSTGIFFFTLFILSLVAWLAKAYYNYSRLEKRGWEILPGYECIQNLRDRCSSEPRFSPQVDYYDKDEHGSDYGGRSYQTDL